MQPNTENTCVGWRKAVGFLLPCLAVAVLVRSFFFGTITLADDVNYWMQIIATGLDNSWPPEKSHWHTRIGFILPCVFLVKIFGLKTWVPYLFTLLGGLLEIAFTYIIAREFVSEKTARLATWLAVFFPLNILYSGYLLLDLWSGFLAALSLWFWYRGLRNDRLRDYILAALFFGFAWLCRETIIMAGPIYIALWVNEGCWKRPKILWAIPVGLSVLLAEMALYQLTIGNWYFRFEAILNAKAQMLEDKAGDPGFFLTPLVQLITSHELGLFLVAGLGIACFAWKRMPRALVLWLVIGFFWFSWGTTTPGGWVPMQRDPRYLSILTIPCLVLLAAWLIEIPSARRRGTFVIILMASGIICACLDVGRVKTTAHRNFAASEYNAGNTTAEPFVYFGIRAAEKFSSDFVKISCANDLGRVSATRLMPHLPGTRMSSCEKARYAVFSEQTQPEKWKTKMKAGWHQVAKIPGDTIFMREFVLRFLGQIRGQETLKPAPGLIVLENPVFTSQANGAFQSH